MALALPFALQLAACAPHWSRRNPGYAGPPATPVRLGAAEWDAERAYCRGQSLERAGWAVGGASLGISGSLVLSAYAGFTPVALTVFLYAGIANAVLGGALVGPALIASGVKAKKDSGVDGSSCDFGPRRRAAEGEP